MPGLVRRTLPAWDCLGLDLGHPEARDTNDADSIRHTSTPQSPLPVSHAAGNF